MTQYNKDAVDRAIRSSKQKIGRKEAKLIHAILRPRHTGTPPPDTARGRRRGTTERLDG